MSIVRMSKGFIQDATIMGHVHVNGKNVTLTTHNSKQVCDDPFGNQTHTKIKYNT